MFSEADCSVLNSNVLFWGGGSEPSTLSQSLVASLEGWLLFFTASPDIFRSALLLK